MAYTFQYFRHYWDRLSCTANVYIQYHIFGSSDCSGTQLEGINTELGPSVAPRYFGPYQVSTGGTYGSINVTYSNKDTPGVPQTFGFRVEYGPTSTGPWTVWHDWTPLTTTPGSGSQTPCQNGPPPTPCQYGTRASATAPAVALITDAALTTALVAVGAPWLAPMFGPLVGEAILTGSVCATLPPAVPALATTDLLATVQQKAAWLNSLMWWTLCECVPPPSGQQAAPLPTKPTLTQPTDFPAYGPYSCSNSDICSTLVQILKRLDELNGSQQVNFNQTTTIYGTPRGIHYTLGTVHSGLTGSGSLTVSNLAGVRVNVRSSPSGPVLPGNPQYLWDQGWMSVTDGAALLMERRIARTSSEWFPPEMNLVTQVGYWLHAGVVVDLVELVPA